MGLWILIGIILSAGLLGGIANYYMNKTDRDWLRYDFVKSSLLGLTAAATVPLFLKTVSSNLMKDCLEGDVISYFVFFGFCTVAAIFSSKFLQSLADKILKEVEEVKQKQEELGQTTDTLVLQNSDPADAAAVEEPAAVKVVGDGPGLESLKGASETAAPAMTEEQKILKSIQPGRYAFRTLAGISRDTGLDEKFVAAKLAELEARGAVKKIRRAADGATVWSAR